MKSFFLVKPQVDWLKQKLFKKGFRFWAIKKAPPQGLLQETGLFSAF